MLALMALQASAQAYHYDVNNDKQVNVTDIMLVVNKILGNTTEPEEHPLTITVSENPLISSEASGPQQGPRRSPEVTTESLNGEFYVSWMYKWTDPTGTSFQYPSESDNTLYTYQHEEGDSPNYYETSYSWPSGLDSGTGANTKLTVFGFNDGEFNADITNGKPYLFVVKDEQSNHQTDLIVAKNTLSWNESDHGNVPLQFNHVCSAFQFYIMKSEGMKDYFIDVSKVVLHNIKKQGRYYLMSDEWSFSNEDQEELYTNYTLKEYGNSGYMSLSAEKSLLNINDKDYLFIIPQTITSMAKGTSIAEANNQSYIEISCSITKDNQRWPASGFGSVYLPFNPTFRNTEGKMEPGYIYPIIISVGTSIRDANGNPITLQ